MSITDELRDWFKDRMFMANGWQEIHDIADHIDAEHEQQCAESWMRGHDAWAAIDRIDEMAEHGWIRLPKDADGEYINIGDVMVYADGNTCPTKVVALVPPSVFLTDDGPRYADMCRHKPTTVEDVLAELTDEVWNRCCIGMTASDSGICELVAEYAAKLQLREVDE